MMYSAFGILALTILIVININVFVSKDAQKEIPASKQYRSFLISVILYFISDVLWGFFYECKFPALLTVDTYIYFVFMAASILMWTKFVIAFLASNKRFNIALSAAGWLFFSFEIVILIINLFIPAMFSIDETAEYHAHLVRYIALMIQIGLFFVSSIYALIVSFHRNSHKLRYNAVGVSGFAMMTVIILQLIYPFLPFYTIGLTIAVCILHTFVVADINKEKREELEKINKAMKAASERANTDSLTGVKSKHAYIDAELRIDERIKEGSLEKFGVIVFDVNELKTINDMFGHIYGDGLLKTACRNICERFKHSPVYRIGGDEFVVILEGSDYDERVELLREFDNISEENIRKSDVVTATGMAEYIPGEDKNFRDVFIRADNKMYERKDQLKRLKFADYGN